VTPRVFVLISGAWHGAWCWHKVVPLLEAEGHRVITPDLPGVTLEGWARFVAEVIAAEPEPVVLVGHSRGGAVISRAAELAPARVRRLVYVAGYLLQAGGTVAGAARADTDSLVPPNMIPAAGGATCLLRASVIREALFGQCTDEDYDYALARLAPEPLKPLVTALRVSEQAFGRIPRAYIECSQDRAITLAAQRRMRAALPCSPVYTLDSDHSPFLSHPVALASLLGRL
jgi:pimeloyl-ACP methyl ester carboxylesterase